MRADLLDGVVVFTRVAEKRSFTAAALELGVTPAAVSWSIKRLEARVGSPLLARTTRSVHLTEAGQLFLDQANAGVAHVMAAFEAARGLGSRPQGLLRLNAPYVAQTRIEPILAGFAAAYPEVQLELVFEDRYVDIVAEGYDAGIRLGETIAQDMVAVRLTKASPLTVVGSPGYFVRRGKPGHPQQLDQHSCINIRLISGALHRWPFVERLNAEVIRTLEIDVNGPLIVNGPATGIAAAVSGVGLHYNISSNVQPLVEQGLLEACLEPFMPESPGLFAYFPHRNQVLPKLKAFLNFWSETNNAA